MHVVAHLSDPHLDGSQVTRDRFLGVVDHVRRSTIPIDAVVVTGDVLQDDATAEYALVRHALDDGPPWAICPGNSDARAAFRAAFATEGTAEASPGDAGDDTAPVDQLLDLGDLRVVLLDSLVPGSIHGELRDSSLSWLGDRLGERPGVPTLVGWHHPPVALGHAGIDPLGLQEPDRVAEVLRAADDVVAVLVGHAHAAVATTFAGHPLLVAPGIHSQLVPPFEVTHEGPPFVDTTQPPGFAVHVVHDDGRITSYFRLLTQLAG
ncbi:metallophosphoesterase [Nitriliruptor alkaliphilus]|uniref:metallophosphoesterase n=1 Tax=Nitriliruptor alkaliphilus TaxID=427918 RepID=UPI000695E6FF|nr:metallophosphoesterase [Nitriliruptor alkaliphilus]